MTRTEYKRNWRRENKDKVAEAQRKYLSKITPPRIKDPNRPPRGKTKEERAAYQKYYRQFNKLKITARRKIYEATQREERPELRIKAALRQRIRRVLKGKSKSASSMTLLGCSLNELKSYLENKFKPNMTWENYGEWHIDHIRPCASFDLLIPLEQEKCFHYTNLQPLWAKENLEKGILTSTETSDSILKVKVCGDTL
jgi:hypothetical protein